MISFMKVSICCITYNHGRYIAAALDSFLAQQVTFDYEIVIGEDCSSDDTLAVIKAYQSIWGDRIRLIHHAQNIGMMENFITTVRACRGEYIAFCEGDDYWTDPLKLAKQIQFLDNNPDHCMSYHNCFNHLPGGTLELNDLLPMHDHSFDIDSLEKRWFMPTMSVVIRNTPDIYFPEWIKQMTVGDLPFFLLYARSGKIRYFSEPMGAYRIHASGSWSSRNEMVQVDAMLALLNNLEGETFSEKVIQYLKSLRTHVIAKGFIYVLFRGTASEYQAFTRNPDYGYSRYQHQPRALLRIKYSKAYLKDSKVFKRFNLLVRKIRR